MSDTIKFGTDGWRAIIGKDFIPQNIETVIQAFCDASPLLGQGVKKIVLGYDRRNQSPEAARLTAEILAANGFTVLFSNQFCPTPCVSWMTKNEGAFCGIVITASHNPANWNGIKFKESYGGSASPEYTSKIEQQIETNLKTKRAIKKISFDEGLKKELILPFNPQEKYVNHLRSLLDVKAIQKSGIRILNDPLFGAGTGFMKAVLEQPVTAIHTEADTTFGGLNPEPIDKNLGELLRRMQNGEADIGLATDGDADRIGAVDENGNFVNSHLIFALLLKHYIENKKLQGAIVKSLSTTQMINRICDKYGLACIETPVGFKHICKHLVEKNALMGGEESGGLSFAPHVHERDGVLNGLFLVELMSLTGKKLTQLVNDLYQEFGEFYFDRIDAHVEREKIMRLQHHLQKNPPEEINGENIVTSNLSDGFKYILSDGSWLLIRASGTEPLIRLYAESGSPQKVQALLHHAQKMMSQF